MLFKCFIYTIVFSLIVNFLSYSNINKIRYKTGVNCEHQFGDGFKIFDHFCDDKKSDLGLSSFECRHNVELQNTICEAKNILIDSNINGLNDKQPIDDMDEHFDVYPRKLFLSCKKPTKLPFNHSLLQENSVFKERNNSISKAIEYLTHKELNDKCKGNFRERTYFVKSLWSYNIFHVIIDMFNLYQTKKILESNSLLNETKIIIVSSSDKYSHLWSKLFGSNISSLYKSTNRYLCFESAIFVPVGVSSGIGDYRCNFTMAFENKTGNGNNNNLNFTKKFLTCKNKHLMLVNFVKDFLSSYGVEKSKNNNEIRATLILRNGSRAFKNEKELIDKILSISDELKVKINLTAVDLTTLDFKSQLDIIVNTNILIGIHGAGLTFSLFLKEGSVVLEMLPKNYFNEQYKFICHYVNVVYNSFFIETNEKPKNIHKEKLALTIDIKLFEFYFKKSIKNLIKS